MFIFPAIDLYEGQAVRLLKGDYNQKTVYSNNPVEIGTIFKNNHAEWIHIVDLEGAKYGTTPNLELIQKIKRECALKCEVGGGIRNMQIVDAYLNAGLDRVILGTAAVTNPDFLKEALQKYGEQIAVGIDIKDGYVAIKGWLEKSQYSAGEFVANMDKLGVKTLIVTDISKDGAMMGPNFDLYNELAKQFSGNITASGGVSCLDDIKTLRQANLYGAIIGKAYYSGAIKISDAIEVAK